MIQYLIRIAVERIIESKHFEGRNTFAPSYSHSFEISLKLAVAWNRKVFFSRHT